MQFNGDKTFLSLSIWWYLKWNSNQTFYVFLNMQFVSFCTVLSSQFVVSSFRRTGMKMVQRYFAPVECVKSSTSPLTRCHVCSSVSIMSVHNRGEHDLPCQYHRLHWSSWFPSSIPPPDKGAGSLLLLQFHSCNQGGTAPPYYLEWGTLKMIVSLDPIPTQNLISNVQKDIKDKKYLTKIAILLHFKKTTI